MNNLCNIFKVHIKKEKTFQIIKNIHKKINFKINEYFIPIIYDDLKNIIVNLNLLIVCIIGIKNICINFKYKQLKLKKIGIKIKK